ncbi:class I SAM-dependent DNA methyltransferase [Haloferax volcanii]|uniref:Class I SAM-dependent methyltransferase n=1 Tax=Haloferax volcanii TaxID=2246 RepID=A0A558FS68_HALVO|nr:class I SAM-dependent methyltransferase [Haloferax volcanii]TVT88341.1 class I SAM-dependent methyltransferase [Haloferax volcanii]
MTLSAVIEDLNQNPYRQRTFYEYPELYDFYHSRVLNRDVQSNLLKRIEPDDANRVLEFGCGTGPLLTRIENEYEEVLGVDSTDKMLALAREKVTKAEVRNADFTEWSAADDGRIFDAAVLMGGMLHLTDDSSLMAFVENVYESLRDGGAFGTFFQPLTDDVENGSRDVQTVESDRFSVERHSITALTSSDGRYTTTYLFHIQDKVEESEAKMGTVFHGRLHDAERLKEVFVNAGFSEVELMIGDGPTTLRAVK